MLLFSCIFLKQNNKRQNTVHSLSEVFDATFYIENLNVARCRFLLNYKQLSKINEIIEFHADLLRLVNVLLIFTNRISYIIIGVNKLRKKQKLHRYLSSHFKLLGWCDLMNKIVKLWMEVWAFLAFLFNSVTYATSKYFHRYKSWGIKVKIKLMVRQEVTRIANRSDLILQWKFKVCTYAHFTWTLDFKIFIIKYDFSFDEMTNTGYLTKSDIYRAFFYVVRRTNTKSRE